MNLFTSSLVMGIPSSIGDQSSVVMVMDPAMVAAPGVELEALVEVEAVPLPAVEVVEDPAMVAVPGVEIKALVEAV